MQKAINDSSKHVIVCGSGTTGARVIEELLETKTPFVVVDINEQQLTAIAELKNKKAKTIPYIIGDATEDKILEQAGINRASGLVAALRNDKDNLYLILSARQINPDLRIVARATEKDAPAKMRRAGADSVVAPNILGGLRIASEMIRPDVTQFLDEMLRDKEQNNRFEQISIPESSPLIGKKLSDSKIRKATDVLVIAIKNKDSQFTYNPGPNAILEEGAVLVVLGANDSVIKLRKSLASNTISPSFIPIPHTNTNNHK